MPDQFIKPILVIIAISISGWILFWTILRISKKKEGIKIPFRFQITSFLFYIYAIAVLSLTIIPLPFARFEKPNEDGINIIPIVHIVRDLLELLTPQKTIIKEHTIQNIIGNIILFIPLGIFLPLLIDKYRCINKVILAAFICSVSIELIQLILRQFEIYRSVDIDDVILNTLGALLGFMIVNKFYFNKKNYY